MNHHPSLAIIKHHFCYLLLVFVTYCWLLFVLCHLSLVIFSIFVGHPLAFSKSPDHDPSFGLEILPPQRWRKLILSTAQVFKCRSEKSLHAPTKAYKRMCKLLGGRVGDLSARNFRDSAWPLPSAKSQNEGPTPSPRRRRASALD